MNKQVHEIREQASYRLAMLHREAQIIRQLKVTGGFRLKLANLFKTLARHLEHTQNSPSQEPFHF